MHAEMHATPHSPSGELPRRMLGTALGFLVVVALLGTLLRWQHVRPLPGINYANFVHAHSHVAFLGWVFNAFFAIALHTFLPSDKRRLCTGVFLVLQVAVAGMLVSYPLQGYGAVSIAFSTLHMIASAVFGWNVWRHNHATPVARNHLRVALLFWALSGLGPLTIGPLAAFGLRDSPAYQLTIYFYLHGQYNGWFLFFLQAVLMQTLAVRGLLAGREHHAGRALRWLAWGAVLTLAQSTLWLNPPAWVYLIAGIGGALQLVGCAYLLKTIRGTGAGLARLPRLLVFLALGAFLLKHLLQAGAALPALSALASHRFIVVAFLHLVFLGVVAPALFAWTLSVGWLRDGGLTRCGLGLFLGGAVATEVILVGMPLGWLFTLDFPRALLAAALAMSTGAIVLFASFFQQRPSQP